MTQKKANGGLLWLHWSITIDAVNIHYPAKIFVPIRGAFDNNMETVNGQADGFRNFENYSVTCPAVI